MLTALGRFSGMGVLNPLHRPPTQSPANPGPVDEFPRFLEDLARWNPNLEPSEGRAEPMRTLMLSCRRPPVRNEIAAGSKVDQAVNAVWAAMVYHTPALHQALKLHGNQTNPMSRSHSH